MRHLSFPRVAAGCEFSTGPEPNANGILVGPVKKKGVFLVKFIDYSGKLPSVEKYHKFATWEGVKEGRILFLELGVMGGGGS